MTLPPQQTAVKTRLIVLSDTHGTVLNEDHKTDKVADVAVHCGDLTEESKLDEFNLAIRLLRDIRAPLKLVIAGNHDFTLDTKAFKSKIEESHCILEPALVEKTYGKAGQARALIDDAKSAGIILLDEGHHTFSLDNGAMLTVYASPYTPARGDWNFGDWGFQYNRADGHNFAIPQGTNLVMTHGPPHGILDMTAEKKRAGCSDLFGAVARAKPQLHCFGHIHSGWGAKLVTWRDQVSEKPSHFTDIDNDKSTSIDNLKSMSASEHDSEVDKLMKAAKAHDCREQRCYATSHTSEDRLPLKIGEQTLFINAAMESDEYGSFELPWLVEVDLPSRIENRGESETNSAHTMPE